MAYLTGLHGGMQVVSTGNPGVNGNPISVGGPTAAPSMPDVNTIVIDGTPVRVVVLALAAAAGLTALKFAGFKFNVGVST